MPTVEEKKAEFDQYWREQPQMRADPRSIQRASIISRILRRRFGRMLDIGCGRGLTMDYFTSLGYDVTGADISPDMVTKASEKGHKAFITDIERDQPEGKYEIILCLEVLQQLYYPVRALKRIKDALEDDGELVVSLPNEFHIVSRLKLLFGKSHLGHYSHSHIRLFSPDRDESLFERVNLRIVDRVYVPIVPPRWRFLSRLFSRLMQKYPSLFAISSIYNLRKL